jgi:predicted Zn-dependent protease
MTVFSAKRLIPLLLGMSALYGCEVSQDQEVAIGKQNAEQINQQLPLVTNPDVEQFVNKLGRAMASHTARADLDWQFRVVDSRMVNAFALPGGFIYVNRGLIERADNVSELAGVLGHEIGHVTRRHAVLQMEKAQKANIGVAVLCTLTSACDHTAGQVAINVGGGLMMAKHSRKAEQEADSEAVINVLSIGIDPNGIPSFFEELIAERARRPLIVEGWFSTHPLEESRVRATRDVIANSAGARSPNLIRDLPEFQRVRAKLAALPPPPEPVQRTDIP